MLCLPVWSLRDVFPTPEPWAGTTVCVCATAVLTEHIHFINSLLFVMVSSLALSLGLANMRRAAPAKEVTRSRSPIYARRGKENVQGPAQRFRIP